MQNIPNESSLKTENWRCHFEHGNRSCPTSIPRPPEWLPLALNAVVPLIPSPCLAPVPKKADARLDALSAEMAEKNKLVGKVSALQKTTGEVCMAMPA